MMRSTLWVVILMAFCMTFTAFAQEETTEAAAPETGAVVEKTEEAPAAEGAVTEEAVTEEVKEEAAEAVTEEAVETKTE